MTNNKYIIVFEEYERYGGGHGTITKNFEAENFSEAVRKVADHLQLYLGAEQVCPENISKEDYLKTVKDSNNIIDIEDILTGKEALDSINESNGDGCDFIVLFKNETTGEVYIDCQDCLDDDYDEEW